jgi:hypothetical protein
LGTICHKLHSYGGMFIQIKNLRTNLSKQKSL